MKFTDWYLRRIANTTHADRVVFWIVGVGALAFIILGLHFRWFH